MSSPERQENPVNPEKQRPDSYPQAERFENQGLNGCAKNEKPEIVDFQRFQASDHSVDNFGKSCGYHVDNGESS